MTFCRLAALREQVAVPDLASAAAAFESSVSQMLRFLFAVCMHWYVCKDTETKATYCTCAGVHGSMYLSSI